MKKICNILIAFLLVSLLLAGCGIVRKEAPAVTEAPVLNTVTEPTATETEAAEATAEPTQEEPEYEGDASSYYIDVVYTEQIARYYDALSQQWTEGQYFESGLSALPYYYYQGNPLENVGFGFVDLDGDGVWELVIGAILNAQLDPSVFEIWTLADGEPVMLAQGGSRNRYALQHSQEDDLWLVANEGSNSAANHVNYSLMLSDGEFSVVLGILFDAMADEENPWFLTYDLDWDTSNDTPIDEETAESILESNRNLYTPLEYIPYSNFK